MARGGIQLGAATGVGAGAGAGAATVSDGASGLYGSVGQTHGHTDRVRLDLSAFASARRSSCEAGGNTAEVQPTGADQVQPPDRPTNITISSHTPDTAPAHRIAYNRVPGRTQNPTYKITGLAGLRSGS